MTATTLTQLLEACRSGDPAAIEALVREHEPRVYRLALSLLDDPAEAEEAAQDALVAALAALGGYRGDAAFSTWLYTIAVNVCRRRLRRRAARARLHQALRQLAALAGRHATPEDQAARRETGDAVWRAVSALDQKHRVPVVLRYYHDLSCAEIARILDLPTGTVESRLHTARERLRAALAPRAAEDSP